jgi:serine/threonine protein kinase
MNDIARDEADMALGALLQQVDRPVSEALQERIRSMSLRHFGASEPGSLLAEGATLGRYRIERVLGAGGQAVVYLARHAHLPGRLVALKVPHPDARARMLREADVMARLDHPGVLGVVDVDADAELPYLVLEHCVGGSLADRVEAEGPLPEHEVARIGRALLDALEFAHDANVVHRDLKPENVLFDADGHPCIADFGLGKVVAEQVSLSLSQGTHTGIAGTPTYMAPEQERPGADVDGRTDLFALGKLLYFMLTAQSPRTLRPVERSRPDLSPAWSELIFSLTEALPDARPAHALEARAALDAIVPSFRGGTELVALPARLVEQGAGGEVEVTDEDTEGPREADAAAPQTGDEVGTFSRNLGRLAGELQGRPGRTAGQVAVTALAVFGYVICFFLSLSGTLAMVLNEGEAGVICFIIVGFFLFGSGLLHWIGKPERPSPKQLAGHFLELDDQEPAGADA